MATTFKVGDKVRALTNCVFNNDQVYKGTEYTITSVDLGFGYVGVNSRPPGHPASEFELVPELPRINFYPKLAVGDVVKVTTKQFESLIDVIAPITKIAGGMHYVKGVPLMRSEIEPYKEPEYVDPFPVGTRVYVKAGGSNIGDKDGLYVGVGTIGKHWDTITKKTRDRAVRFDSEPEAQIYCYLTRIVPIEDAPPTYDFQPGDIVKPKMLDYSVSKIVEYVEDAKAAYPKLTYTGPAVIYKRDSGNGYPSWDRARDVVLYERPVPVVEPERKDWTDLVDRANTVADTVGFVLGEENNVSALIDELTAALVEESYR